jgi:divalent metal cation (Fe/Co/Zn/Cd) transporter
MPTSEDDIAAADRLGHKRAQTLLMLAALFLFQQAAFFAARPETHMLVRTVDQIKIGVWVVLSAVLLLVLLTGGMWLRGRTVRHLLNDDVSRANRAAAVSLGFFCAMTVALLLYVLAGCAEVSQREAIHAIVTAGIVPALLRFGILERRALG